MAIEMTWLKILLILVKLINILKQIIELIVAILFPIIQILALAIGAWINPPNIPVIATKIAAMVVAIILKLIALITQMIWDLLNLDCVAQQTADIIEQIRRAMSVFRSIMSAFDPTAISMMANDLKDSVMNPLEDVIKQAQEKKEAWKEFGAGMKDMFSSGANLKKAAADTMKQMTDEIKSGLSLENIKGAAMSPFADKYEQLKSQVQSTKDEFKQTMQAMQDAQTSWATATAAMRGQASSAGSAEAAVMGDPSIIIEGANL
jgi:prefoldin subunit 5